ncbi:MAG TPA: radical SAM family heme chaperone HemW [Thermodesulfobacteriota bacterium]|nr:radical SAM family heme chaperone HemW [Thermodesulfobacteriota bacterium]
MAFGVYIHIPYCVKKCPYCDFNSWGINGSMPEPDYTGSILRELELYRDEIEGRELTSVFFGGGTPSLFDPGSIERIIRSIYSLTAPAPDIEVSLEVNPKTADLVKLRGLRDAGVNRISVGVQSFSKRKLEFLGRINTPEDGRRILGDVSSAGFRNYNFDLMYGTGGETPEEWRSDLEEAVTFGSSHISAYCLTIEKGTEFGALHSKGKLLLPGEETLSEFIDYTTAFLAGAGYPQYEISNYSRPGCECRHNLLYWKGEDYIGLGAGAHSHLKSAQGSPWGMRWSNVRPPAAYMKSVEEGKKPVGFSERLSMEEAVEDRIIMGFRLNEGLDVNGLRNNFGVSPDRARMESLSEDGFIEMSGGIIRLTKKGTLLSDEIIVRLVSSLG